MFDAAVQPTRIELEFESREDENSSPEVESKSIFALTHDWGLLYGLGPPAQSDR